LINLQEWAEGELDDQLPLEVLYCRHPETDEEIMIVKIDTSITVCKGTITTKDAVAVVGTMAQGVWESYESKGILRPDVGGVG
jgi:hypothetical protein